MSQLPQANPALALRSRRRIVDDAVQGLGSSRGAHVSIRGGRFRLIDAKGVEKLIDTHYLDVIIIDANDKPARVYFDDPYDPSSDVPPACFSDNGIGPSTLAMMPQAPTCAMCPCNVRGTKQTFTGKATTACENRKKVAAIIPDDTAINVYEFQIPPGSLSNFKSYCTWLGEQVFPGANRNMDIADVVTRVSFDPDKQFVMAFAAAAFADDDITLRMIQYIDENKLSDVAVGRNDVACDPENVKALLAGRPATATIAAPAPQAQPPQGQQFALPPRQNATNGAAVEAPKLKRQPKAQQALPASNGATQIVETPAEQVKQAVAAGEIPAFLRRAPAGEEAKSPLPNTPPRFGVGQAPPPPAEIADALNKAMALPTRRA